MYRMQIRPVTKKVTKMGARSSILEGFGTTLGSLWAPFGTTLAVCRPPWASFWMILALFYVSLSGEGAQKVMKRVFVDDLPSIWGDVQETL